MRRGLDEGTCTRTREKSKGEKAKREKTEESTREGGREMRKGAEGKDGSPRRVAAFASARGQRSSTFAPECPW